MSAFLKSLATCYIETLTRERRSWIFNIFFKRYSKNVTISALYLHSLGTQNIFAVEQNTNLPENVNFTLMGFRHGEGTP